MIVDPSPTLPYSHFAQANPITKLNVGKITRKLMACLLYMKTDKKTLLLCCLRHVSPVKILIVEPKFIKNSSARYFDS